MTLSYRFALVIIPNQNLLSIAFQKYIIAFARNLGTQFALSHELIFKNDLGEFLKSCCVTWKSNFYSSYNYEILPIILFNEIPQLKFNKNKAC